MRPLSPTPKSLFLAALGLAAALATGAQAADLDEEYGLAPPLPPPVVHRFERSYSEASAYPLRRWTPPRVYTREVEIVEAPEVCRVILKPRLDPYGREVMHRVRICDEGAVAPPRRWVAGPHPYGYAPPPTAPLPPREIGPDFDGEPG